MIIAISGLSGCGKNTVGERVAQKLRLRPIRISFKDEAAKAGMTLMEYQQLASKDERLDRELDARIVEEAKEGDCVIMTWLGPWMVKNCDLRVWLNTSEEERARRVAKRDGMSEEEALAHIRERDANNRERYMRYYKINIDDRRMFDLEINTDRFTAEQAAELIAEAAELRRPRKYELG